MKSFAEMHPDMVVIFRDTPQGTHREGERGRGGISIYVVFV